MPKRRQSKTIPRSGQASAPARSRTTPMHAGFTLVELVTVLVLIAILAVFAVSRLDFPSIFRERGFHDVLKASLQYARKAAIAERRYVCVTVSATAVSFTFDPNVPETIAGSPTCAGTLALPVPDTGCGGAGNQICVPSGVSITAPAPGTSFWFDARGAASAGFTFSSTGQPDLTLEQETGYVH